MKQAFFGKRRLFLAARVNNKRGDLTGYIEHVDLDALRLGHGKIRVYTPRSSRNGKHLFDEKLCRAEFFEVASEYQVRPAHE